MLVVIILGGIYSGIFTATEAAAMAAVYSFLVSCFVYRALELADVPRVLLQAASMSAMLLYVITNAVLFSFVLTNENISSALADPILSMDLRPWSFLLIVNILLLIAGNFMEPSSSSSSWRRSCSRPRSGSGSTPCISASSSTST